MKKRKGTKETIEDSAHPYIEHRFVKYPGRDAIEITDYSKANETEAHTNADKFYDATKSEKPYKDIHTHPSLNDIDALPSAPDLKILLTNKNNAMVIAVRTFDYFGNVIGYHFIKKTKLTPKRGSKEYGLAQQDIAEYANIKRAKLIEEKKTEQITEAFEKFAKKYHIKHRLVPAKGYRINATRSAFVKEGGLEKKFAIASILISLIFGIFFFLPTFTGNTISNFSEQSSASIGSMFFIIALVAAFFYFLKRKIYK